MSILDAAMAIEKALHVSNLREFFSVQPRMRSAAGGPSPKGAGEIELKDVSFKYPGSDGWALRHMSMHIRAGETVALVGENGAGKSTLAKLIARLYDPCEGTVLFDGRDVRAIPLEDLHGRITFVFQNFGRYEATLSDNIGYGDWRRLLGDKEAIGKVAQSAGLGAMISRMPKGFDTMLGRAFGEFTLSGGQWQQVALARAFARDAVILILDEPTSNLDARAEYELFSHYRQIAEGRTTILISHRFSTVSIADRIFLVDRGQIVESGTHGELLAKDGHYASLYRLHRRQMGSQE
jgi:ATP-binding cassette subfamily B protein